MKTKRISMMITILFSMVATWAQNDDYITEVMSNSMASRLESPPMYRVSTAFHEPRRRDHHWHALQQWYSYFVNGKGNSE